MFIRPFLYTSNRSIQLLGLISKAKRNGIKADDYKPAGFNLNNDAIGWLNTARDAAKAAGKDLIMPNYPIRIGNTPFILKSGINYYMPEGGQIIKIPSNSASYQIIDIDSYQNGHIINFNIRGDGDSVLKNGLGIGQYGFSFLVRKSKNVTIWNPISKNSFGDAINISNVVHSENITIINPYITEADNHAINIVSGTNIIIEGGYATGSKNFNSAGVNIEPLKGNILKDITIKNFKTNNNNDIGFKIDLNQMYQNTGNSEFGKIHLIDCFDSDSKKGLILSSNAYGYNKYVKGDIFIDNLRLEGVRDYYQFNPAQLNESQINLKFKKPVIEDKSGNGILLTNSELQYYLETLSGNYTPRPILIGSEYIPSKDLGGNAVLEKLMRDAKNAGLSYVFLEEGTYTLNTSLTILDGITLVGKGITKTKIVAASSSNGFQFIRFNRIKNSGLMNMTLDGNSRNRIITRGSGGVEMSNNCHHNLLDNVLLTDFGPGNFITISAQETDAGPTYSNIIRNCILQDNNFRSKFGIRLYTEFQAPIPDNMFVNHVYDNQVINCELNGFYWNPIELVGPATRNNLIKGNYVHDTKGYGSIEADKGPKYNIFEDNITDGMYGSGTVDGAPGGQVMAYRTWGVKPEEGVPYERFCIGNTFINNIARNIENDSSKSLTGGIVVNHSTDTIVHNNTFDNIRYDYGGTGAGVILMGNNTNVSIKNNTMSRSQSGVFVVGGANINNVDIIENTFSDMTQAYKSYAQGTKNNIKFLDNELEDYIAINKSNETNSVFQS